MTDTSTQANEKQDVTSKADSIEEENSRLKKEVATSFLN